MRAPANRSSSALRHGIDVIYHASFTDEEALDMLEAAKDRIFVAPGLAWLVKTSYHASEWGLTPEVTAKMGYHRELEVAIESLKKMHKRGVSILPGGDYGFAWIPARHQRHRPRILRQVSRLHADGGARRRHQAGRPDHDAAATSSAS